jgi:diaminohydroxyphosphoribosylaminopyrimidine deaminase/5-amino-6-(5-phosphoribosylamino)uracil reductase
MQNKEFYMLRCIELAEKGAGSVAPNPMVGAVLVHAGKIIGEGWHQKYGEAHAEVNCINDALSKGHEELISSSVLYVSLEPCAHYGKTPPCADLIIRYTIKKVVIGCADPFDAVNGKGIQKLKAAGVNVTTGVLEKECRQLNIRFFTFHQQLRPYIILKWAETKDGFIAGEEGTERLLISSDEANRLVHKWRSEEAAILVGTNTALKDNPHLTTRLYAGASPTRLVVDMRLTLPDNLNLFNTGAQTIIFNKIKSDKKKNITWHKLKADEEILPQLLSVLKEDNLQSVLVEGGALLLQSFITAGLWDEIRVIKSKMVVAGGGIKSPEFAGFEVADQFNIGNDVISVYINDKNESV